MNPSINDIKSAFEAGLYAAEPKVLGTDHRPFVVVPSDAKIIDLEPMLKVPARKRASLRLHSAQDFAAYLVEHKSESTRVFADLRCDPSVTPMFIGVIDYHGVGASGEPGWREHVVQFVPEFGREFLNWRNANMKPMNQEEFALFIDRNAKNVTKPDAATMMEIALNLEGKRETSFSSGKRLENGDHQLIWTERTETGGKTKGNGTLEVPSRFTVTLPVFIGGNMEEIEAKLRYRISDGQIVFFYELYRVADLVEASLETLRMQIEKDSSVKLYRGSYPIK